MATRLDPAPLPAWGKRLWHKLRDAFLVGAFVAGILVTAMNWYKETFPQPTPATADQLHAQSKHIQDQLSLTQNIVRDALRDYTDSLQAVRAEVEESMAKPILTSIIDLKEQVRQLQRGQVVTGLAIEEQRQTAAATTQELLDRINARPPDRTAEALQAIQQQLDDLRDQLPVRRRTLKTNF